MESDLCRSVVSVFSFPYFRPGQTIWPETAWDSVGVLLLTYQTLAPAGQADC